MTPEERAAASAQARAALAAQALWKEAQSVLFFAPLPEELDVWPLLAAALAAGKKVALPCFVAETRTYVACQIQNPETDLEVGHFGIREPGQQCSRLSSNRLDLILVPGVAFDLQGRRLGRGKGYYDALLTALSGTACGVAFDQQIVTEVPVEPHDVRVNCLLTPTRWVVL
jgi:5-formyltetrahydrofolate cyclo-ligase